MRTSSASTLSEVWPVISEWTPQELLPIIPPSVHQCVGGRIGAEGEPVPERRAPQVVEHRPRPDPGRAPLGIDPQHPRQMPRGIDHHRHIAALPGQARPRAPMDDRRAIPPAGRHGRDQIVRIERSDDPDRHLPVVRGVGGVDGASTPRRTRPPPARSGGGRPPGSGRRRANFLETRRGAWRKEYPECPDSRRPPALEGRLFGSLGFQPQAGRRRGLPRVS